MIAAAGLLAPALAAAQADPKFTFVAEAPVEKPVEWKVLARAGGLITTGNSQTKSAMLGLTASRKAGDNRLALDGGLAYGTTNVLGPDQPADPAMPTVVSGVHRTPNTTTNNWFTKGRYDRFLTANNSAYASGQTGGDRVAGKKLYAGGQIGYSRQLIKDSINLVVAELGYDFSNEWYVQPIDAVAVHSLRVFLGETAKLSPATALTCSGEAFFNVNKESKAINAKTGMLGVDPFKDTRVAIKGGLTTTIFKSLSFAFGVSFKYDQNPAVLPLPALPVGQTYAPGVRLFANTIDTVSEATLIYTFL